MSFQKETIHGVKVRGDVSEATKSNYSNPRYPLDGTRYKNWMNLTENCKKYNDCVKRIHLESMIRRKNEARSESQPDFLKLMYLIRYKSIVKAYFPKGSVYDTALKEEIKDHPGWKDLMTRRERSILTAMFTAYTCIEKDPSNTAPFDKIDKTFGIYRHDRWALAM
jgi:hypothetical protein